MQEQQQDAGATNARERVAAAAPLYSRSMPGGGYVRVELLVRESNVVRGETLRGRVIMERRAPIPATTKEEPVVVEEIEGDDPNIVVAELFRIARDNAAIARRVLRRLRARAD